MKKIIKIGFRNFWSGFNPKDNMFTNMLKKYYRVVLSDDPDYVFYSVYSEDYYTHAKSSNFLRKLLPKVHELIKKSYLWYKIKNSSFWFKDHGRAMPSIEGNFVKIFFTPENCIPDMNKCDWAFSFCYDEEFKHPKHMRLPYYFFSGYGKNLIKRNINFNKIKKEKTKFCNFVYANDSWIRNRFFNKLSKYKRVDAPGKCMNNLPPIGKYKNAASSRQANNWIEQKQKFLNGYKFTIAFENAEYPGYTTEKITQAMLANSIPLYFGNPLVSRDFNKKSFLNLSDFKNMGKMIKRIKEIDSNDKLYASILNEPWFNNNKPSVYVDERRLAERLKQIFG